MATLSALLIFAALAGANGVGGDTPRIFVTSVMGDGNLSTWPDANGASGIAAADAICRARANAALIANADDYVALLSDSTNDAYCRWHGASGTIATNCGEATLPTGAGPWFRMDGLAEMDVAQNAIGTPPDDGGYVPRPIVYDEFGHAIPTTDLNTAFTATGVDGRWTGDGSCVDWTSADASFDAAIGHAYYGYGNADTGRWSCDIPLRLICLEKGRDGTPLIRSPAPSARIAFVTSSTGSGDLSSWPDADGATSLAAGDAICRAHAARAHLPLADTYKAWLSTATIDAIARFANDGPLYRVDGVRAIESIDRLAISNPEAPVQFDENGHVAFDTRNVWTSTDVDGSVDPFPDSSCAEWTSSDANLFAASGRDAATNGAWTLYASYGCDDAAMHLYCFADNDSLFLAGFDD
jgi:hypothetical protein